MLSATHRNVAHPVIPDEIFSVPILQDKEISKQTKHFSLSRRDVKQTNTITSNMTFHTETMHNVLHELSIVHLTNLYKYSIVATCFSSFIISVQTIQPQTLDTILVIT